MKYIILYFSIFLLANQISADFPLPIPEPNEGNFSSKGTSPDEPLPPIDASSVVAEQKPEQAGAESVSEIRSADGEEPKIAETKQAASEPAKEKKTKLPNLADKKDKKNGKKKETTDPSRAAYERGLLRLRNGQKDAAKEEFGKAASTEGTASSQAKLELSKLENTKAPDSNAEAPAAEDDSRWKTSLETARSLRAQGKNSEAESILLRTATEGEGEYRSRALLQLGDMLFRMGRYSDARSYLMDFWNRFGKTFPNAEDSNSREFKRQREEKELGAYLLFKSSYKAGEGEWAKRFLKKYLDKSVSESQGVYSPLRTEMESFAKSDL
ncbi:tetratricopeptide repeat protein [Leptospira haakeii]|uniref:Tetratricopeptide repeat protein n=1 Tax=Leptospira haakeii TaxID=2023198 RepID=A0ABX4PI97_9LEPT|nr:tetratricopeptide repeat protein [Leptospira haakeii]PKA15333.1 hypothetical protein CH363_14015 [Leptospira haakeii]PKA18837.1 hypothetical protein CH377_15840 [Leptospira haakeii]